MNDGSTAVAGEAESQTNLLTKQFTSVTVRLKSLLSIQSKLWLYLWTHLAYGRTWVRACYWFAAYQWSFSHATSRLLLWYPSSRCKRSSRTLWVRRLGKLSFSMWAMRGAFCYNGTMNNLIKSKLELLPTSPGCYIHKDKTAQSSMLGRLKICAIVCDHISVGAMIPKQKPWCLNCRFWVYCHGV